MAESALTQSRRRFGIVLALVVPPAVVFWLSPGLPVMFAPSAPPEIRNAGLDLFLRDWEPHDSMTHGDGLGPVFNASSCVSCHFQGGVGGGGGNDHNVLAFEALPTKERRHVEGGLIHKFAVSNLLVEDPARLRELFPIIPEAVRISNGCQILVRDFDPVRTESINSTALFGAGWIDCIPAKQITHQSLRESFKQIGQSLEPKAVTITPGRYRVLPDGRIGKFGWKAQFATLEDFVAAACANEIGLGNPRMKQAKPNVEWKYPEVAPDLDEKQIRALTAFVDTLPRPETVLPASASDRVAAARGQALFGEIGCASCHTPTMAGIEGVYSDFLLHRLEDRSRGTSSYDVTQVPDAPLPAEHPLPDEWKTPPLWGVADSAPYFHDGGSATLEDAVLRHRGSAEPVYKAYQALAPRDRQAILKFLETLRAPTDAPAAPQPARHQLALNR
jgi:CxxC motif-containing protein (DUF1111 family)